MGLILLNPGPVTLSERVRQALLRPDLCHRESEFAELQTSIRAKLLAVYGLDPAEWAAVLLTGSGTAAVEAMLTSLVPADGGLVVLENGVYGERMGRIAAVHGIRSTRVGHPWGAVLDGTRVRAAVQGMVGPVRVAAVHHETTTGLLNPTPPPGLDGRAPVLLDAVSSFGGEPIAFGAGRVEACAGAANKCLHGVPGAAFVLLRRALLAGELPQRSVYLDLATYCRAQDAGSTPFTQSVQAFYALDEALDELRDQGGWTARRARYRTLSARVRDVLAGLGVEPLLPARASSSVLSAFRLPPGRDYASIHDGLKRRGFVVYAGQGRLADSIFRIAVMGAISDGDVDRLLDALRETLA